MTNTLERHIFQIESVLVGVDQAHAGVTEEHVLIKAKLAALAETVKKLEGDKKQLLAESQSCAARLGELEAEQNAYRVQIDALRKAGGG